MSETITENNSLNLTAKSGLHLTLDSVNQMVLRLRDMRQNRFKVNQSPVLNNQVND